MIRLLSTGFVFLALAAPATAQETRASAAAKFRTEFKQSDTNGDGALSRAEAEARVGQMKVGSGRLDATHRKRLAGLWFTRADADKDGKVTEAEAQALLAATFDKYDADRDGRIGGSEKAAARSAIGKGR